MRPVEVIVLLALSCALTVAEYNERQGYKQASGYEKYEKPAHYKFGWDSKDGYGNSYGHEESRDNDKTTGSYYVHLPDGRLQKVTYYVDGNSGFQATVTYEGEANSNYKSPPIEPYNSYAEPLNKPNYHRPNYVAKPVNPSVPIEKSYIAKEVYPTSYKTNPFYAPSAQPYNSRSFAGPKMAATAPQYPVLGTKFVETPKYSNLQHVPVRPKVTETVHVPQKYPVLDNKYAQTQKYSIPLQIPVQPTQSTQKPQYSQQNLPKASAQDVKPSTRLPPVTLDSVYTENYQASAANADPEPSAYSKESSVEFRKSGEENRTPKPYASIKLTDKQSTYVPEYEPKPISKDRDGHSAIKPKKVSQTTSDSDSLSDSYTTSELTPRKKSYNLSPSYTSVGTSRNPTKTTKENGSYKTAKSSS